ncbi:MAG: EAL domain-containing protein [Clostridiales bacterium]|nr:EAL domain-containing protein [Clostridiales bacterium]
MKSIRAKLTVTIILLFSSTMILLSGLNYLQSKKVIDESIKKKMQEEAIDQAKDIQAWIDTQRAEAAAMARSPIIEGGNMDDILSYMRSEWRSNPQAENILYVEPDGKLYGASGIVTTLDNGAADFNLFISGKTIEFEPVISQGSGRLIITVSEPVVRDGVTVAAITIPVTIEVISNQVLNIKEGKTGFAYVVRGDGMIIIHPDSGVANIQNLLEDQKTTPELKRIAQEIVRGEYGFSSYKENSMAKYISYAPVTGTNWSIVINVPVNEVNRQLIAYTYASVLIILAVLIISVIIILIFSSYIVRPIEILESEANRISSGDLRIKKVNVNLKDEVGNLSRAFEKMVENLSTSYEELEALYEEITASDEELKQQYDELQNNQEELRISEERFKLAVEAVNDSIWDWDIKKGSIVLYSLDSSNRYYERSFKEEQIGLNDYPEDAEIYRDAIRRHLNGESERLEVEHRIILGSGEMRWLLARGRAIKDYEGRNVRFVCIETDITERKKTEEKIQYLAHYDLLTDLPNRLLFVDKLQSAILEAERNGKKIVILYLDLDNFKSVNDTMGHTYGDLLLKETGVKLLSSVRAVDSVARLGGDEFGILLGSIDSLDLLSEIIERIMEQFKVPFLLDQREFFISTSIGVAIYPFDGETADMLMKNADAAMYSAKNSGKNCFHFYEDSMNTRIMKRLEIENSLRRALERKEFVLFYQPQVNLANGRIEGFEALIRWQHPTKGLLTPADFIQITEETGLIIPIGEWVLRTACQQVREWEEKGYGKLSMAVNLSARQFRQADMVERICEIVSETGIDMRDLELEITESTAMEDLSNTVTVLDRLKSKGIKIALDDFGTGYSSLNYLKKLPIDRLKIDKDFVYDLFRDKNQKRIAHTIIQLAHNMGLEVVAEGVETNEALEFLKKLKCNRAQGYLFSKPLPYMEAEGIIGNIYN